MTNVTCNSNLIAYHLLQKIILYKHIFFLTQNCDTQQRDWLVAMLTLVVNTMMQEQHQHKDVRYTIYKIVLQSFGN